MKKLYYFIFLFVCNLNARMVDLEDGAQPFVLSTTKIEIPGHPHAFNPSIIRWNGKLLLSFRTYCGPKRLTNLIGLVWLDEDFRPISTPYIVRCKFDDRFCLQKRQDPRLIAIDGRLYIAYNNVLRGTLQAEIRRMLFAELTWENSEWVLGPSECILHFQGEKVDRSEKNWSPFEYQNQFRFICNLYPHRIFSPILGSDECELTEQSRREVSWRWGVLRGGTPALRGVFNYNEYLSFFHSSHSISTVHSQNRSIPHYFMGAYTFSGEPPFEITQISSEPIIGKNFYHGMSYKTWKPLCVVFPGGFVFDDHFIWVAYGRQDHEVWIVKLDKRGLEQSLIPVRGSP